MCAHYPPSNYKYQAINNHQDYFRLSGIPSRTCEGVSFESDPILALK